MVKKKLYYKISEVCEITNLKSSVLRFWEKEFPQLLPFKTSTNRRFYTLEDIEKIKKIKHLLYEKRMTIEGARKYINQTETETALEERDLKDIIQEVKKELESILNRIRNQS